ncbi:hypothetical protein CDD80_2009 [Ophiocordyceps camponoti-rufipedis]|uniref:Uncharacterized protein n=1 Tax=Ophiocordyceps camponoti-rufipedis TaxID=2004952 RepID=A0A2C5Z7P5_9HYPO|nr:hypothetical protein CDD80_2009 [Ophiocordyceps camponoti-rufipedis]
MSDIKEPSMPPSPVSPSPSPAPPEPHLASSTRPRQGLNLLPRHTAITEKPDVFNASPPRDRRSFRVKALKEDPRVEVLKEDPRVEVLKEDPRVKALKEDPRVEAPKEDLRVEVLKEDPKVEVLKEDPRIEALMDDRKATGDKGAQINKITLALLRASTLDTSASTVSSNTPQATQTGTGQLGNAGIENNAGNLPTPSPIADGASQTSRSLPTSSIVGIALGVTSAALILGVLLWIGRKYWRKAQARKKSNRARSRSVSPRAEANDEPRLWQTPAVSTQAMASVPSPQGPTMKDRFIGLWSRRPGPGAPDPTPRAVVPVEMSGGNPGATPDNGSVPELPLDQDGFGVLNPFADTNATSHEPAYFAQAYMEGTLDPFADPMVVPSPVLVRPDSSMSGSGLRSHRRSVSASVGSSRYPVSIGSRSGLRSSFRSLASSFAERRNKFRSDPFDLEIEGLPDVDDIPEMPALDTSNAAYTTHMRSGSQPSSSYYTSGVNSDWTLTRSTTAAAATGPPLDPEATAAYPGMPSRWTRPESREQRGDGFGQAR